MLSMSSVIEAGRSIPVGRFVGAGLGCMASSVWASVWHWCTKKRGSQLAVTGDSEGNAEHLYEYCSSRRACGAEHLRCPRSMDGRPLGRIPEGFRPT